MKVLIATPLYAPEIGGPATYTAFLEMHLPPAGVKLAVVPFARVRRYPKLVRHLVYTWLLLRASHGCGVVYALDPVSVGVPALLVSVLTRKPLYLRVPGDYAWEQGQQRFGVHETLDEYLMGGVRPLAVRFLAWVEARVARSATRVIVPSEYLRRVVEVWGVLPARITRVYSALKAIPVAESREVLRTECGYRGFVVVTAARLVPWKGVAALIEVIALLRSEGVDASLEVLGDGVLRDVLEASAREKQVSEYVHFRGSVDRSLLGGYVKAADAFVLNTSYEGLSHQLTEVMSLGTPIVTTPVGGNSELITDGVEGLMVPWNDVPALRAALLRLKDDATLRTHLADAAYAKVQHFHEDVIRIECVQLFS